MHGWSGSRRRRRTERRTRCGAHSGGFRRTLALLVSGLLVSLPARAAEPPGTPPGDFILRVYYRQIADLAGLADYDVHEYNNLAERYVRVSANRNVRARLESAGWQVALDEGATAALGKVRLLSFNSGYRTVDRLHADLQAAAANHPALAEVVTYGQSYNKFIGGDAHGGRFLPGYDLKAIRVTNRGIPGPKPVFFLMAGIHAREITTPEVAMRFLQWLLEGYGADPDATWLVDCHETWIVPTVNPDGHWIVERGSPTPYYQRKNAHRAGSAYWPPDLYTQYGVDLNRNHDHAWNRADASADPLAQTYPGRSPASEPEVAALQDLIVSLIPDQRGPSDTEAAPLSTTGILVTLHSYGGVVLWPWGFTFDPPPNAGGLRTIGSRLARLNGYVSMQSSQYYPTSGTSDQWVYAALGIPAFTIEMGAEFMPAYTLVDAEQWPANRPALVYACKIARTPYLTAQGPEARGLKVTSSEGTLTVEAVVDDSGVGSPKVTAAECAIDIPWWSPGARPLAMLASDGAFGGATESVRVSLSTALLQGGRHLLWVRGQGSAGQWGPPSAAFCEAIPPALRLRVSALGGQRVLLAWDSLTNLAYSLQVRTDWDRPWEDTSLAGVPGTGGLMTCTNPVPAQASFFRLHGAAR